MLKKIGVGLIFILVLVGVGVAFWIKKPTPPNFSLKLPNGWYQDLSVKSPGLLAFSPEKTKQGIYYRAFISAGVAPTNLNLASEVARAKQDIGAKFLTDKSITIHGYSAHLLEYNKILDPDPQNVKGILGEQALLTHHTDIIAVKDGYLINVAAYTYEWAWPEFVDTIEKSLRSLVL